jgi:hypothetical protein
LKAFWALLTRPISLPYLHKRLLVLSAVAAFLYPAYLFLWVIPEANIRYEYGFSKTSLKEVTEAVSDKRRTIFQLVGGIGLLLTAIIAWRRMTATEKTLAVTQEGKATDLFVEAIKLLGESGDDKLAMRLGGIYALERIARTSRDDHGPIMEILTAYVREKAPHRGPIAEKVKGALEIPPDPNSAIKADIQAILTVLGRRTLANDRKGNRLDLHGTNLREANLKGANLRDVNFFSTNLSWSYLEDADLRGALFSDSFLWNARLRGAKLAGANFYMAGLCQADLRGTNLAETTGISQHEFNIARSDEKTIRPAGIVGKNRTEECVATEDAKGVPT